jgi:hypothetical protein
MTMRNLILGMFAALLLPSAAWGLTHQAGGYELQVLVGGVPVRTFSHGGETYVMGQRGDRYTLRVINRSGRRVEAVVTVDGRDVVDGKTGDYRVKRGYVVQPFGHVDIDGWRLSQGQVAAFRFSSVADSYAARTGSARDVGVIGVALFPERQAYVPPPRPYMPRPRPPMPYDDYRDYDESPARGRAEAAPKSSTAAPPPAQGGALGGGTYEGERRADKARDSAGYGRPGLGTGFGERVDSQVYEVEFVRQNSTRPVLVLGLRYNDREGLISMGVDVDGWRRPYDEVYTRRSATPFPANDRAYAAPPPGWEY